MQWTTAGGLVRTDRVDALNVERILRRHPRIAALKKRRTRIVALGPKPSHRGEPDGRQVVVALHDYDAGRSMVALVDVKAKKVVALQDAPAHFQLSVDEQREAEALAAKDPRVRQFVGRRRLNPLTRLFFPRAGHESRSHRCAIVFIRPSLTERRYAIVDFSLRRVVDVVTRHALTGR
jgi:uncharacterized protein YciI